MDYGGGGGDWASFVDDRGSAYWVHPATGAATYANPYGPDQGGGGGGYPEQNDGYGGEGYGNEGYGDEGYGEGYGGEGYGGEGYGDNEGYGGEGYGGAGVGYGGEEDDDGSGWRERGRVMDAVALAAAELKASRGGGVLGGQQGSGSGGCGGSVAAATSLAFDHAHELLWVGRADGGVQSFALEGHLGGLPLAARRHCAYQQCAEGPVLALLSLQPGLLSLSQHRVRVHARGGFGLCEAPAGLARRGKDPSGRRTAVSTPAATSDSNSSGSSGVAELPLPRGAGGEVVHHGWLCMCPLDGQEHRLAVGAASGLVHVLDIHQVRRNTTRPGHLVGVAMPVSVCLFSRVKIRIEVYGFQGAWSCHQMWP